MPDPTDPGQPSSVSPESAPPESAPPESVPPRRAFLRGALGAGAAGAVGGAAAGYAYRATRRPPPASRRWSTPRPGCSRRCRSTAGTRPGILPQPRPQTAVISFNATADGRAELTDLFRAITARARFLTAGGTPPPTGIGGPPSHSGVLGPAVVPDGLTVTAGVGSTLFDDRYGLAPQRPAGLTPMRAFPDDALDPAQCGGDLVLQLSAGNADTVVHALRDIARHTRGGMQALWRIDGYTSPARPSGTVPRNMLGFMDGIANPDTGNRAQMDRLVWSQPGAAGEPAWTAGGSYFVIRLIRMLVEFALNLISGQTGNAYAVDPKTGAKVEDPGSVSPLNSAGLGTVYGDPDPAFDDCSDNNHTSSNPLAVATGKNIGDLLNARNVSWGWFQGGFAPTGTNAAGFAVCGSSHANIGGNSSVDYSPHHNPFEYYKSTANPKHLPPSSEAAIGHTDQANHQYDLSDFYTTLKDGNMPAVSFLKAAEYQDAHPGYSDPLDEQTFLVNTINQIEKSKFWKNTAIVIAYDDSDGWYDHQKPVIVNGSNTSLDAAICSSTPVRLGRIPVRCGFSQRLPMLVISPWSGPTTSATS